MTDGKKLRAVGWWAMVAAASIAGGVGIAKLGGIVFARIF